LNIRAEIRRVFVLKTTVQNGENNEEELDEHIDSENLTLLVKNLEGF